MKQTRKEMIAAVIREGRMAKGYTQKELAELSNISVRSIQRIENGEILPRSYTLKSLARILDRPFEDFASQAVPETADIPDRSTKEIVKPGYALSKPQRIILSVGIVLIIFFLFWAFIAQSPRFPETSFELLLFAAFTVLLATGILSLLWRRK